MQASEAAGIPVETYWHPFELNPGMEAEGENLREHIMRKYGSSAEQSQSARDHLTSVGKDHRFDFQWNEDSRIYNKFAAHQLLHWASESGQAQALKLALFDAYFTQGRDVSDPEVLIEVAASIGLDAEEAKVMLQDQRYAETVRQKEQFWTSRGVSGVPTMVFDAKQATSGAQGVDTFARLLQQMAAS